MNLIFALICGLFLAFANGANDNFISFARGLNDTPKIAALLIAGSVIDPTFSIIGIGLFIAIREVIS